MACPTVQADLGSNYFPFYLALEPDASHLWVYSPNLSNQLLHRFTWPGLSLVDTVAVNLCLGMVMRGDGTLCWISADATAANWLLRTDQASPTTLHTYAGATTNLMLGYSMYDDGLWVIWDGPGTATPSLERVDPDTGAGAGTEVQPIAGSRVGNTAAMTPTLDGGLWIPSGSGGSSIFTRYDIPTDTVQQAGVANIHTPIPQPDDTAWYFRSSLGRQRDAAFTESLQPCMDGFSSHSSVAYTQDLETFVFGRVLDTQLYSNFVAGSPWTVGRVAWGSRGAWH